MKILKCNKCGKVVVEAVESGAKITCCDEIMTELTANTVDAAKEKHVPVVTETEADSGKIGDNIVKNIVVSIGSVIHPMTEEHHIAFIAVEQCGKTQIQYLCKTGEPKASFNIDDCDFKVYAYCNLHGLWSIL